MPRSKPLTVLLRATAMGFVCQQFRKMAFPFGQDTLE
jgi:hypothetical protein